MKNLPLVIDIGMNDGSDTAYYLETGHRVIAVEAHPAFAKTVIDQQSEAIADGRLTVINAAITPDGQPITLQTFADNPGGATTVAEGYRPDVATEAITARGITMEEVLAKAGARPKYVKVDIEGADGYAIKPLTKANRPEFASFEMLGDAEELANHLSAIGFTRFKVIEQSCFREISRMNYLGDRLARKVMRSVGFAEPQYMRRGGRWFSVNSSGPAPWESDGNWGTLSDALRLHRAYLNRPKTRNAWFDLHAS